MNETPYNKSAEYYDFIYLQKSKEMYETTLEDLLNLAHKYLGANPSNVLDLACGTGTHAIEMAKMGIEVTGIDLSSKQLEFAREKAFSQSLDIEFIQGDLADLPDVAQVFDAGAVFFGGFGYLLTDMDVLSFLRKTRPMIREGGFLYFEFWNTLGVIDNSKHYDEIEEDGIKLLRYHTTTMDINTSIVRMPMKHLISKDDQIIDTFIEDHQIRTYTIPQLQTLIEQTDWRIDEIYAYGKRPEHKKPELDDFRLFAILV